MQLFISAALLLSSAQAQSPAESPCANHFNNSDRNLATLQEDVCTLGNQERRQNGQGDLRLDAKLSAVAQRYAEEMSHRGFFDHVSPEGQTLQMRYRDGHILYMWGGENIARGQPTPTIVISQWMASPSHRKNLLNPRYHKIGVGVSGRYWVQHFTD